MKSMMLSFALLAGLVGFSACEQVIEIDLPDHTPQLVVNSFFSADSVFRANVGISKHVQDTGFIKYPTDVLVIVYEDGSPVDTLRHDTTYYGPTYMGSAFPQPGHNYTIRASKSGFETVEGTDALPPAVPIQSVTVRDSVPESSGFYYTEVSFTFDDPVGKNYYIVGIYGVDSIEIEPGVWIYMHNDLYVESDDPSVEVSYASTGINFSDVNFEGQRHTVRLRIGYDWSPPGPRFLVFRSVSEHYFKYKRTTDKYYETSFDPFAEPVILHSNMTPEMGIFAGFSASTFRYQ